MVETLPAITKQPLTREQQLGCTLRKSQVAIRQYEKAFKELKVPVVVFTKLNGEQELIDETNLQIARGISWGAYDEMRHTENGKAIADMIIFQVDDIPDEDLYLK